MIQQMARGSRNESGIEHTTFGTLMYLLMSMANDATITASVISTSPVKRSRCEKHYCMSISEIKQYYFSRYVQNVMFYDASHKSLDYIHESSIDWATADNSAPLNEPRCGYSHTRLLPGCPLMTPRTYTGKCLQLYPDGR